MSLQDALKELKSLNLDPAEYCVFGSGPMYVFGIKQYKDLDIYVSKKLFAILEQKYRLIVHDTKSKTGKQISLFDGRLEIFNAWVPGTWKHEEVMKQTFEFFGIKFVSLELVKKWKMLRDTDKDKTDIRLIDEFMHKFLPNSLQ